MWHHAVIARRLPASIKAPHERSGLSAVQYSMWLDTHGVQEVTVYCTLGALMMSPLPQTREDPTHNFWQRIRVY